MFRLLNVLLRGSQTLASSSAFYVPIQADWGFALILTELARKICYILPFLLLKDYIVVRAVAAEAVYS